MCAIALQACAWLSNVNLIRRKRSVPRSVPFSRFSRFSPFSLFEYQKIVHFFFSESPSEVGFNITQARDEMGGRAGGLTYFTDLFHYFMPKRCALLSGSWLLD